MPAISVIIPTLNSACVLPSCLASVGQALPGAQVLVADGGSTDRTREIAASAGATLVVSQPGRGVQMNAAARQAEGQVLFFLHADSVLVGAVQSVIETRFADPRVQAATCRLRFDRRHRLLALYGWLTRFDSLWTSFGDQGIIARRDFFWSLGGFPEWPLFEDVHFLRLARRQTRIVSLPVTVVTSAARFVREGVVVRQLRNAGLILQYLAGVPVDQLRAQYEGQTGGRG